jgi:hypothetical protein
VSDNPFVLFGVAFLLVAAATMLMHERHYQSRRELILLARVETLEKIVSEDRRT